MFHRCRLLICSWAVLSLVASAGLGADPTASPAPLVIRANVDAPWGGQIADVEKVL